MMSFRRQHFHIIILNGKHRFLFRCILLVLFYTTTTIIIKTHLISAFQSIPTTSKNHDSSLLFCAKNSHKNNNEKRPLFRFVSDIERQHRKKHIKTRAASHEQQRNGVTGSELSSFAMVDEDESTDDDEYISTPMNTQQNQQRDGTESTRQEEMNLDTMQHQSSSSSSLLGPSLDDVKRRQLLLSMLTTASTINSFTESSEATIPSSSTTTTTDDPMNGKASNDDATIKDYFTNIIVPPLDDRTYVSYTLQKNNLRVLLVSDPTSNEAAVAMNVHVGACSDPIAVPGLAHFNEHMLFLGTKQYPKEDQFESFLSSNGGSSNAYTDSENTVYYFNINVDNTNTKKLEEGMKRFGSFFTNPLFTESATAREVNAIDSENAKNLQSDTFRLYQIDKARINTHHPYSKFFTGNKDTLVEQTQQQNINVRNELIQFYNTYYSSNQMTLAIIAPQSIETLQQMVQSSFANIPNTNRSKPEEAWNGIVSPYPTTTTTTTNTTSLIPAFYHITEVVPVQELRQLNMKWPIVYQSDLDRQVSLLVKPSNYVAHLLGHEGQGSLLSYLKKMGWANSIAASTNEELSDFETFEITIGLTITGLTMINSIMEAVYSYIRLLTEKEIPDYIYKEVLQLEELQWRYTSKGNPRNYVTSLVTSMQLYPPSFYVAGPRRLALLNEYDQILMDTTTTQQLPPRTSFSSIDQLKRTKHHVQTYIQKLTVDNAILTVISKSLEQQKGPIMKKERWYGTNYRVRPIDPTTLERWKNNCPLPQTLKLAYPKPNPFIPTENGLRVKFPPPPSTTTTTTTSLSFEEKLNVANAIVPPRMMRNDVGGKWIVYFKEDTKYNKPNGYIVLEVLTKEVYSNVKNAALANFYELALSDRLREYTYDAGLAGLIYEIKIVPRGIRLTFGGYNEKIQSFASFVSKKVATNNVQEILPKTDQEFEIYKDQIMRSLYSFDVKQPYAHASYYSQLLLQPRTFQYTNQALRDATRSLTLPDLRSYAKSIWNSKNNNGKGIALIQGNFYVNEALELIQSIGDVLPFQSSSSDDDYPAPLQALSLPTSNALTVPPRLLIAEPNPNNENCATYVMLQSLIRTDKEHVLFELFNSFIEEPFYNELRTKKQLGYIVAAGVKGIEQTRTISFVVQSNVVASDTLTIEILSFLDQIESSIVSTIKKGDLEVYIQSLIDQKLEPDKDLATEVTRNWSEIINTKELLVVPKRMVVDPSHSQQQQPTIVQIPFNRRQQEVIALLSITKEDIIDFWKRLYLSNDSRRAIVTEIIPRQGVVVGTNAQQPPPPLSTGYSFLRSSSTTQLGTKNKDTSITNDNKDEDSIIILGIDDIERFRSDREKVVL